jgi:hypothetical protein
MSVIVCTTDEMKCGACSICGRVGFAV